MQCNFLLYLRIDMLSAECNTCITYCSWLISGAICSKQSGLITVWVCASKSHCSVITGCTLGFKKWDVAQSDKYRRMTCVLCCYKLHRWDELYRRRSFAVQSVMLVTSADCSGPLPRCHWVIGLAEEEVLPPVFFLKERWFVVVARVWGCGHCNHRWKSGFWASRWLRCSKGSVEVGGGAAPQVWKADPGSELQPPSTVLPALKARV